MSQVFKQDQAKQCEAWAQRGAVKRSQILAAACDK